MAHCQGNAPIHGLTRAARNGAAAAAAATAAATAAVAAACAFRPAP